MLIKKILLSLMRMNHKTLTDLNARVVVCMTSALIFMIVMLGRAFASPRMSYSQEVVDVGRIESLSSATNSVAISNSGDLALEIHRVRACCGAKASVSTNSIAPGESATLTVSLGPMAKPGPFRKKVTLYTNDPAAPVVEIPIVGEVAEAKVEERGSDVVVQSASAAPHDVAVGSASGVESESISETPPAGVRLSLRLPVILLAGLVDGFNPCAFSIIIVLAGILAVGGRLRKARFWGGIAFCAASYATYMAMGLGLVSAIRAVSGFGLAVDVVFAALAATLFVLSLLSFRDALNYHRKRVPAAITLQLPDKVKAAIRNVAKSSWSGTAVVGTGLVCGVLVTLLDSLCTGQVYVPVLALLAKERHSVRALVLLAIYNLAFIAPLVAVFVLAAKGADSERMSRWSKRNVVPSKIMLGVVFAVLAYLLWPDFAKHSTLNTSDAIDVPSAEQKAQGVQSRMNANPVNHVNPVQNSKPAVERMSDDDLAAGNDRLDALVRNPSPPDDELSDVVSSIRDEHRDLNWRNYCLQVVPELIVNIGADDPRADALWDALEFGLVERGTSLPGTALLGLDRLHEKGLVTDDELSDFILVIAQDAETLPGNRVTALRLGAERGLAEVLPYARRWAKDGEDVHLRKAAISVLRDIGMQDDIQFLRSLLPAPTRDDSLAIGSAIAAIRRRSEVEVKSK